MIKRGARSRQSTPRYEFPEHLGTLGDSTLQAVSRDREAAACLPVNDLTPLVGAVHGVAEGKGKGVISQYTILAYDPLCFP